MNDELLKEVDEAVRQEKLHSIWNRFGNYIIAASAGIVAVTVAVTLWKSHEESTQAEATAALIAGVTLQEEGQTQQAAQALAAVPEAHPTLSALARVRAIAAWQAAGEAEKAATTAEALASDERADVALRDYAALVLAVQQNTPAPLEDAAQPGRPFAHTAREIKAALLHAEGKTAQARELLSALEQDALTPSSMRTRAAMLKASLGEGE